MIDTLPGIDFAGGVPALGICFFGRLDTALADVGHEDSVFDAAWIGSERCHGRWRPTVYYVAVSMEQLGRLRCTANLWKSDNIVLHHSDT